MRIRPIDIQVPGDDPFANDRLDRRDQAEAIASILARIEGPFVLAIDAPWGEGKTTFLRMSQAYLRKKQFLVIDFNAWETDFCDDPFIALTAEIIQGLERYTTKESTNASLNRKGREEIAAALESLEEKSQNLISWKSLMVTANFFLQRSTGIDLSPFMDESSTDKETLAETKLKSYGEQKQLMRDFIETLSIVGAITANWTGCPLVIYIDELDRCRPTYAIELLETVKHLFSVDNVVFVLGINRAELAHSIRAVYGEQFKAERYLSRLIDIDLNLPRPDIAKFVGNVMDSCEISKSLRNNLSRNVNREYNDALSMVREFLSSSELSVRDIAQSIHHLGLVVTSLHRDHYPLLQMTVILLAIRSLDRIIYEQFTRGEATDLEIADCVFRRQGLRKYANTCKGAYIEAYLIHAYWEILREREKSAEFSTPLLMKYRATIESETATPEDKGYAKAVIDRVHGINLPDGRAYTRVVISRIELFAKSVFQ